MDFDKIFSALRNCITEPKCKDCPWEQCEQFNQKKVTIPVTLALDVLNLLKEQEDLGTELTNAVELIHKKNERIEKLLKEQEAVKPTPLTNRRYACGNCGNSLWVSGQRLNTEV